MLILKPIQDNFQNFLTSIGGGKGISGILGGLFGGESSRPSADFVGPMPESSFFDFLPSFDVGTPYVPHDMVAKIHQGEAVIPASQNRGGGGDVYQIYAPEADAAGLESVKATILALNGKIDMLAGPGKIERRVNSAISRNQITA
jgi:hypothetical protein